MSYKTINYTVHFMCPNCGSIFPEYDIDYECPECGYMLTYMDELEPPEYEEWGYEYEIFKERMD